MPAHYQHVSTTKILNAFNYFYVLNAVVNLLRGN